MFRCRGRRAGLAGPVEELVDRVRGEGDAGTPWHRRRHRRGRGHGGQPGEELRREREPLERHVQGREVELLELELIEPAVDQGEGECLFEGDHVRFAVARVSGRLGLVEVDLAGDQDARHFGSHRFGGLVSWLLRG